MTHIKSMIKNKIENEKGLVFKLSHEIGYKNATPLYKFLNEPEREMESLTSLIKIINTLFKGREKELLNEYFKTLKCNGKLIRQALEYSMFHKLEVRSELLNKIQLSTTSENKEWGIMYNLYDNMHNDPIETLNVVNQTKVKSNSMLAFKGLLQVYSSYLTDIFQCSDELFDIYEERIHDIKNNFLRNSFLMRLYTVKSIINLDKGRIEECRKLCHELLDMCNDCYTEAIAYQTLGMSYLFESYNQGMDFLTNAKNRYQRNSGRSDGDIRNSINLHNVFWKKPIELIELKTTQDKHDTVMYFVNVGDISEATTILESINYDTLSDRDKAFHWYCKGLVTGEIDCYYESIRHFKRIGDKYYIKFPIIQLKNFGKNDTLLELIVL